MPGWFDINQLDRLHDSQHDDEKGMMDSVASVEALIQGEIDAGIPANKIVVGGFSQGGAISLLLGLKTERKLAGVVALSTWVPLNHKIKEVGVCVDEAVLRLMRHRSPILKPRIHQSFGAMALTIRWSTTSVRRQTT